MNKDRRRHPRVRIPLEVEYQLKDRQLSQQATLVDLSVGGVAILTEDPLPAGGLLAFLRFRLGASNDSEAAEICAATEIVRCVEQPGIGRAKEFLVGAQFLDLDEHSFETLREFVDRHLGESGDSELVAPRIECEQPIAIQYQRFDDFVGEVATNLSRTGMFIRAKKPPPPGTVLEFSFQLGDDFNLIHGKAEVVWTRSLADGAERPAGMGVKFLELDEVSERVLDQIIEKGLGQEKADDSTTDPDATVRIAELEEERDELQSQLDRERERLEASAAHQDEVRRRLEERVADVEHERDCRRDQQRALRLQLETLQAEREAATAEIQAASAAAQAELETARERSAERQQSLEAELEAAAAERGQQVDALKAALAQEQEARAEASRQIDDLRASMVELQDGSELRIQALREQLAEAEERSERRQQRLEQAGAEKHALEERLSHDHKAEIRALEQRLERSGQENEDRIRQLKAQLGQADSSEDELRREIDEAARRQAELESRLEQRDEAEQALRSDASDVERTLRAQIDRLERELAATRQSEAGLREDLDALSTKLAREREERAGIESALAEAATLREQLSEENRDLNRSLKIAVDDQARLQVEIEEADQPAPAFVGQVEPPTRAARPSALRAAAFVAFGLILGFIASYPFETLLVSADPITIRPATSFVSSAPRAAPLATDDLATGVAEPSGEIDMPPLEAAAVEPMAEPERPSPEAAVERWAAAWSEQRVPDYLSSYASSFEVPDDLERSVWELQRTRRIQGPESILLTLGAIEIVNRGAEAATVAFNQSYVAGAYSDRVRKTLELVWEDGAWRIARESSVELSKSTD